MNFLIIFLLICSYHISYNTNNTFIYILNLDYILGNLTATILDHLPPFTIAANIFLTVPLVIVIFMKRIGQQSFILDNFLEDWDVIKKEHANVNLSFENQFHSN